jgi:hypothetical protein
MQHLQKWDLANETEDKATGEITNEGFGKQFLRHALLGVELLPSPNFSIRAGYNYQRRQELKFDEKVSTVGFSWGFGFKINACWITDRAYTPRPATHSWPQFGEGIVTGGD